jgi:hypothetical protein
MKKRSKKKQAQTASEGSETFVPQQGAIVIESDMAADVYRRSSEEEDMLPTRAKDVALIERSIDRRIVSLIEVGLILSPDVPMDFFFRAPLAVAKPR